MDLFNFPWAAGNTIAGNRLKWLIECCRSLNFQRSTLLTHQPFKTARIFNAHCSILSFT